MITDKAHLIAPATNARISIPADIEHYDKELYPYWHAFCELQMGRPLQTARSHFRNARVIAGLSATTISSIVSGSIGSDDLDNIKRQLE